MNFDFQVQGLREGVKDVTVSRGPGLKRGPGNHENKRKIRKSERNFHILGPKFAGFQGPETLRPQGLPFTLSVHLKGNLQVGRGPVNIGFTGSGQALDAPEDMQANMNRMTIIITSKTYRWFQMKKPHNFFLPKNKIHIIFFSILLDF